MRNRRFAIVSFIVVAVMLMGIGFAATTTTINLTGYINFNKNQVNENFDFDIELTGTPEIAAYDKDGAPITGLAGNVLSASIDSQDPDVGSITAKHFADLGEYVVAKYQIQNKGETGSIAGLDIAVNTQTSSNGDYFTVEKTFSKEADGVGAAATYDLAPGETCWVTIVMTVKDIPTDDAALEGQISWVITATAK